MKRFLQTVLLLGSCLVFFLTAGWLEAKAETVENNENGTITLTYNNNSGSRMKILVDAKATGYRQNYDLSAGENKLVIPLTNGNEVYTVKICKQIEGTRYSTVETHTIVLDLINEDEVFLYSNVIVEFELSDKAVKKASSLTKNCETEKEIVERIHQYVVENYSYDYDLAKKIQNKTVSQYIPDIESVYSQKVGICYDYSVLLAAMLRTQGIEVKVVTGYSKKVDEYHAWNQIYDSETGEWYTVDCTYDSTFHNAGKSYSLEKKDSDYATLKYIY